MWLVDRIGFTGTQKGMTALQQPSLLHQLWRNAGAEFHHGCCSGADAQAHAIARGLAMPIIGHPPINRANTMAIVASEFKGMREPKDYLVRNHEIVFESVVMLAAPAGPEVLRSGTWATIRFAKAQGLAITTLWPDGTVTVQ